jgi:hypothetical protein
LAVALPVSLRIYAGRARLKTLFLEKLIHGGQMITTNLIENYPGFPERVTGFDLSDRMPKRPEGYELKSRNQEVLELKSGKTVCSAVTKDDQSKDLRPSFICTGELMATEDCGIFAGRDDVRCKPWRQISIAVGMARLRPLALKTTWKS